jgi:hypothetical protein
MLLARRSILDSNLVRCVASSDEGVFDINETQNAFRKAIFLWRETQGGTTQIQYRWVAQVSPHPARSSLTLS